MRLTAWLMFLVLGSIPISASAADTTKPSEVLRQVIADYWTDVLRRHPLEATMYVGDHRFDDRVNDPSVAAYETWLAKLRETQKALKAIDPAELTPTERIDLEVLLNTIGDRLDLVPYRDHLIPIAQLLRTTLDIRSDDLHLVFAQLGDYQPAATIGDVENYLRRLNDFPKLADGLIALMKQGIEEKRVPPRIVAQRLATQLRSLANPKAEESPLWAYVDRLPTDWSQSQREGAMVRIRAAIETEVIPAYAKLASFVETEYLKASRDSVGLVATDDGVPHYARLVRAYTTTDLTPDQIHEIGLEQMAKTRAAMEAIRAKVGYPGDLKAFLTYTRTDPSFKNPDERAILEGHRAILETMRQNLPKLFGKIPLTPFEVRAYDPIRAKSSPTGEYLPVPSDGSRPGVFFVNTSNPTSRPRYTMQALAYHEGVPGHHLQGALSIEAPGRSPFRRYIYIPAFDEGWALYSEGLPDEIGLYKDPFSEFGRLNYDALRCVRLVVDTGIHAKNWTRDEVIDYFEANTSLPRNEIENETDRYIATPGQALAYKIGELKIREVRAKVQAREGDKFDIRAFHDRLLGSGSVPLRLMEKLFD